MGRKLVVQLENALLYFNFVATKLPADLLKLVVTKVTQGPADATILSHKPAAMGKLLSPAQCVHQLLLDDLLNQNLINFLLINTKHGIFIFSNQSNIYLPFYKD